MAKRKKLPPGKKKVGAVGVVKPGPLLSISFLDGFLMAQTILGSSKAQALAVWHEQFQEGFAGLLEEYAALKVDFDEGIFYSDDFLRTMPDLESWWSGMAWVLSHDERYGLAVDALAGTELGGMGAGFLSVFEGCLYFGPLGLKPGHDPRLQALMPRFREDYQRFMGEIRGLGWRRRLDYLGNILGLLEGVVKKGAELRPTGQA